MNNTEYELRDKTLFNNIANKYFKKDIYPVSSIARKFQLSSLINKFYTLTGTKNLGTILELGCGVGASTSYLKGNYQKYIGVDYSEEFIKIANDNFKNDSNEFICSNIKTIKINNKDINFIFGIGVLHHLDNINDVLKNIITVGEKDTIYGFIEPQRGNPVIQLMRIIRKIIDRKYSEDQVFFNKKELKKRFTDNNFEILEIYYQGYFSPPFAQIVLKPKWLMMPLVKTAIYLDSFIQKNFNNSLSWNIIIIVRPKV